MANAERSPVKIAEPMAPLERAHIDVDKLLRLIDAHRALVSTYQQVSARYRKAHADLGRLQIELSADSISQDHAYVLAKPLSELETMRSDEFERVGLPVSAARRLIAGHRLVQTLQGDMTSRGAQVRDSVQLMERLIDYARLRGEHIVI